MSGELSDSAARILEANNAYGANVADLPCDFCGKCDGFSEDFRTSWEHLNDDLQVVTLSEALIRTPAIELWPQVRARGVVPADVEALLLSKLAE